jgi:hypothetical protein
LTRGFRLQPEVVALIFRLKAEATDNIRNDRREAAHK